MLTTPGLDECGQWRLETLCGVVGLALGGDCGECAVTVVGCSLPHAHYLFAAAARGKLVNSADSRAQTPRKVHQLKPKKRSYSGRSQIAIAQYQIL